MEFHRLPFDTPLERYAEQAAQLLDAYRARDAHVLQLIHMKHPRFLDPEVKWLARHDVTDDDIRNANLGMDDAQLVLARGYDFLDWPALSAFADAMTRRDSPAYEFECAVEATINGDLPALQRLLVANPDLVRVRSTRICPFDPPVHGAMLLHYVACNGVEGYRQKSPPNAAEIAKALLEAGAQPDAPAHLYGGEWTTMGLLVSSSPPRDAGTQVPLVHTLIDHGAAPDGLMTALVFGMRAAADALVSRGAKIDNAAVAAGLGRVDDFTRLLPAADPATRHRALALAAQLGHTEIVRLLLDAGEDPSRYNPKGMHAHGTPLHHAVWTEHEDVVRLLVERGARLDLRDKIYKSTPLGWAEYGKKDKIAAYLRSLNAPL
jgi:ankyrin repeat protein